MKNGRRGFPLVKVNNGKWIAAIGGYNGSDMNECEILVEFKKWNDLPSTNFKLRERSGCSM